MLAAALRLAPLWAQTSAIDAVESANKSFSASVKEALTPLWLMALPALTAVVILVVGYIVARLLARAATALSEKIGLQTAAERSGLATSMKQVGIQRNVPAIVGLIIFWLLMCVAIMTSFKVLNLPEISAAMQVVVNYIPKLLLATVLIVVGLLVASFLRGVVATSADRVGLTYAEYLGNGFYYVLALITFIAAAEQLGLKVDLPQQLIQIAFAGLALGFGLAIGLGGRDVVGGILAGYYIRQRFHTGDFVKLGEMEGTVREVGPVATTVETVEGGLVHRRSVPNHVMLKEAVR